MTSAHLGTLCFVVQRYVNCYLSDNYTATSVISDVDQHFSTGGKMFQDNLNIFWKKLLVDTNSIFLENVMNYENQKCIIVAFHPRNAPIFNPGLLLWVSQTRGKCGDHVLHT